MLQWIFIWVWFMRHNGHSVFQPTHILFFTAFARTLTVLVLVPAFTITWKLPSKFHAPSSSLSSSLNFLPSLLEYTVRQHLSSYLIKRNCRCWLQPNAHFVCQLLLISPFIPLTHSIMSSLLLAFFRNAHSMDILDHSLTIPHIQHVSLQTHGAVHEPLHFLSSH